MIAIIEQMSVGLQFVMIMMRVDQNYDNYDDYNDNDDNDDKDNDDDDDEDREQSVGGVVHHVVEGHRLGTVCHRFGHNIPSQQGPSS